MGGSPGVRGLPREDGEGAGHQRTPPIGYGESREAIAPPPQGSVGVGVRPAAAGEFGFHSPDQ